MVTVNYYVNPKQKKKDDTFNVKIIVTYKGKRKMLPTTYYLHKDEITKKGKIKDQRVLDGVNEIIFNYRRKINNMGIEFGDKSLDYIVGRLKADKDDCEFFSFLDKISKDKKSKTRGNYKYVGRLIEEYVGSDTLNMKLMDYAFFVSFEKHISKKMAIGTVSLVMNYLKSIYRAAVVYYNDDNNQVLPQYVLTAYKPPKSLSIKKRAISIEKIREIKDLKHRSSKIEETRDIFILSFCLMGMNLVDIFNCPKCGDVIKYNRTKTKDARGDQSYIEIEIDERVKPIIDRHRGTRTMFNFCEKYKTYTSFYTTLAKRMVKIGDLIGEDITFYTARHSFATISYNECGIDKYTVHQMLNHVDTNTKITDVYIKKSFKNINEANRKLLDLLFD